MGSVQQGFWEIGPDQNLRDSGKQDYISGDSGKQDQVSGDSGKQDQVSGDSGKQDQVSEDFLETGPG